MHHVSSMYRAHDASSLHNKKYSLHNRKYQEKYFTNNGNVQNFEDILKYFKQKPDIEYSIFSNISSTPQKRAIFWINCIQYTKLVCNSDKFLGKLPEIHFFTVESFWKPKSKEFVECLTLILSPHFARITCLFW